MTKKQIERAYCQYDKLLHKLSHQCANRCGRPEDEVYGQACWLFMQAATSFDSNKGQFGTYLYSCVSNGLSGWGKKMDLPPDPEHLPEPSTELTPDRQLMFKDWLANLSEECREVATMILNGPAEVLEIGTGGCRKITAGMIKSYLRKQGWTYPRIWKTMHDLKEAVANI
jgi:hypothetical protein